MAAGDTLTGNVRIVREKAIGDRSVVVGNLSSASIDHKDDVRQALYLNPTDKTQPPIGAGRVAVYPAAVFEDGEVMEIQHKSASLEEAIDYDADEFFIGVIEMDLNTGEAIPRELTVADTELTANPTSSSSSYVTFYQFTVPSRRRYFLSGAFNVAAVEVA